MYLFRPSLEAAARTNRKYPAWKGCCKLQPQLASQSDEVVACLKPKCV